MKELYERADRAIAGAVARDGNRTACGKGCFWCCKESVYSTTSEVSYALQMLTSEQAAEVTYKTMEWLKRFRQSGQAQRVEPKATEYRSFNLWCPLLAKDGTCSVYDRRPLACRLHLAFETNAGCKEDSKRQQQKFALFPGLGESLMCEHLESMKGETDTADHLGLLLAKALLNIDEPSNARMKFSINDNTITIEANKDRIPPEFSPSDPPVP